ncbi:UDP-glucose 4-epimerase GalE [Cloacibacillus evryensis]|uniref:UDP-glucose 4-epimerase n=1 Tax=Cloacibacillus evryensis TaxID=508460 RepID=A0AAW5K5Q2_9BACT|nr:UDP-glucose 4-epimerase GalE [Cloacibacillus evryensis]EHL63738.1 UDP-glucose 4-epimerase [Synergistes sp. 3_1_syn1]MCQ4815222.1 UDP-glucose 4-epimerase GalE [Cloacibacillus evryensis]
MKVLITGGAGYIGSHCNRYFADKGTDTVVLDDLSSGHKEAVIAGKFVQGDFGDEIFINELLEKEKFDAIIHFAAFASVPDSVMHPSKYYINNVSKMVTLLDTAVKHGVKYFVFSSSASTFGEPRYIPIDEKHPQDPINAYGMTKLINEKMLADYERAYGIRYCALRYFNAAGASSDGVIGESHDPEHHLIPLLLRTETGEGQSLKVFGSDYDTIDGSCLRDYVHVDDLAEAHYLGLKYIIENNRSECFNMGSNTGLTVLQLIQEFEKITGHPAKYEIAERRDGDPASLVASNEKAKKLLGWTPKRSNIARILRDAWNWEKNRRY